MNWHYGAWLFMLLPAISIRVMSSVLVNAGLPEQETTTEVKP